MTEKDERENRAGSADIARAPESGGRAASFTARSKEALVTLIRPRWFAYLEGMIKTLAESVENNGEELSGIAESLDQSASLQTEMAERLAEVEKQLTAHGAAQIRTHDEQEGLGERIS